ncbi:MAG TPA: hypothetical protein VGG39_25270 [Polyangiaceae bacterium]
MNDAGDWPDGYAHLPPPQGNQGYNAVWSVSEQTVYVPLFSAPDCSVIPPYGQSYAVSFRPSGSGVGPSGTFTACWGNTAPTCYDVSYWNSADGSLHASEGDSYTLSAFDGDGLATGQVETNQGIVPLVVKSCP